MHLVHVLSVLYIPIYIRRLLDLDVYVYLSAHAISRLYLHTHNKWRIIRAGGTVHPGRLAGQSLADVGLATESSTHTRSPFTVTDYDSKLLMPCRMVTQLQIFRWMLVSKINHKMYS